MPSRPHRYLIATGACLVWLLAGQADAAVAGLVAGLDRVRSELDRARPVQLVQADDPGRLARFEVRLARIEEELRQLTGRLEQLEFGQRALEGRIDQLVQDLDQRLLALERGDADMAQDAAPTTRPALAPRADTDEAAESGTEGSPAGDGTLGIVPQSALLDLPRPDPGSIAPPPEASNLPPQQQYDAAMQLLRAGDYAGAEGGLHLFLDLNAEHALAPNAAYWLAETHYVRKNYAAAAAVFARNYRTYGPDAPKAADNLLKLGMSLQGLGESDKACLSYEELDSEFPDAPAHLRQAVDRERTRAGCA